MKKTLKRIFKLKNIIKVFMIIAVILLIITSFAPFFYF